MITMCHIKDRPAIHQHDKRPPSSQHNAAALDLDASLSRPLSIYDNYHYAVMRRPPSIARTAQPQPRIICERPSHEEIR